jgi:CubicO group peptidase (beta-lactamase class C family)
VSESTLSRRTLLAGAATGATTVWLGAAFPTGATAARRRDPWRRALRELDEVIVRGMHEHGVPGCAVGLVLGDRTFVRGYGITNVDDPTPVDGDTVFRIGSTTKTFTGTAVMRLVEQGLVDLDAAVRTYLPDFTTADPAVGAQVTVRQLLNHSPGWLGDYFEDFGPGDDALARYVAGMSRLPQLTPLGSTFAYNNAAVAAAGRIVEVVTRSTYEDAVRRLVIEPLGLRHSRFLTDDIIGFNVAASHTDRDGASVVVPAYWYQPRSYRPTGGLISSAADQLRWARFHLGDGRAPSGPRLLSTASLREMQSRPGPGGSLVVELTGMGVTWMQRPTAEGVTVLHHGGSDPGQYSGFLLVPRRRFGLTLLTNADGGAVMRDALFTDDWALRRFAGVRNLPAQPQRRGSAALAAFAGTYRSTQIIESGEEVGLEIDLRARNGRLRATGATSTAAFAFYAEDRVLDLDTDGAPAGSRSDFVRGPDGSIAWLRTHGRLWRRT